MKRKNMQQTPPRGYRQLRKGRQSIPGFYYSLTVCTLNKRPLLANAETADIIFKSFNWLETNARLKWFCIIVMPDHIHAVCCYRDREHSSLLQKTEARECSSLLHHGREEKNAKYRRTPAFNKWDQPTLWGCHRVVRSDNGGTSRANLQLDWTERCRKNDALQLCYGFG